MSTLNELKLRIGTEEISDLLVDKEGNATLGKLVEWIRTVEDRTSASLPNYLKRATVNSKVFITRSAAEEECLNDLLYCINNLYIGWIMAAMGMNQMVNGSKVRDLLSVVATESLHKTEIYRSPKDLFAGFAAKTTKNQFGALTGNLPLLYTPITPNPNTAENEPENQKIVGAGQQKIIDQPKDFRLLGGTVIDISFAVGPRQSITIAVVVSLQPNIINDTVGREFFKMNFKPDMWMRWFKVTTGEISFFRDFLLEMDRLDEQKKALKLDKSGQLEQMYDTKNNALSSWFLKLAGWRSERQNIANTVQIFTKPQFDTFCHDANCNFTRYADRNKYFNKTYTMIVAVIDSQYNKVNLYIDGITGVGEYRFSQLQNFTKSNNQYDLTSVMRAFAATSAPRI